MSIDYTTILAQIVNFTVLAWALYKFLYKPLLGAIAAREKHIADEVKNAEDLSTEAERKLADLNKRYQEIDAEKAQILNEARDEAAALRKQLEQDARAEILEQKLLLQQEFDREKAVMTNEIRQTVVANFLEFARKAFKRMANEELEERFVSVFKEQLRDMPSRDKKTLSAEGQKSPLRVTTSEELTAEAKSGLKNMLAEVLGLDDDPEVEFDVNPRLLCGVEFSVNGNVVSWNLDDYLNTFTAKVDEALENMTLRLGRGENA